MARDATTLGDRLTVLSISVVYRGCALPVAWKVLRGNVQHPWKPEWLKLLDEFRDRIPAGWTVIVLTDRGLYARWLFDAIVRRGWHPLMRVTATGQFRKAGSRSSRPLTALVPKPGRSWQGRGTAFPSKPERRLNCTLLACWEPGQEEAWFVLTDLGPEHSEALWYGLRAWIEHGFKLLKSDGWQWQRTQMTDPERVERLWLVAGGGHALRAGVGRGGRGWQGGHRDHPRTAADRRPVAHDLAASARDDSASPSRGTRWCGRAIGAAPAAETGGRGGAIEG